MVCVFQSGLVCRFSLRHINSDLHCCICYEVIISVQLAEGQNYLIIWGSLPMRSKHTKVQQDSALIGQHKTCAYVQGKSFLSSNTQTDKREKWKWSVYLTSVVAGVSWDLEELCLSVAWKLCVPIYCTLKLKTESMTKHGRILQQTPAPSETRKTFFYY